MAKALARLFVVPAWMVLASVGCTHEEVGGGEVSFALPEAHFRVESDPNDPRWRAVPPEGIPNVLCSGPAALTDDCCRPPAQEASVDCQRYPLSCDAAGWCALAFDYDDQALIDMGSNVPVLRERRGWVMANAEPTKVKVKVTIDEGFPIESAALYVAPQGVLSPRAPASSFLVNIPLYMDGAGKVDMEDDGAEEDDEGITVDLDANARSVLSTFLVDFNTPFNLILAAHITIEAKHTRLENAAWTPGTFATATFTISGRVRASF